MLSREQQIPRNSNLVPLHRLRHQLSLEHSAELGSSASPVAGQHPSYKRNSSMLSYCHMERVPVRGGLVATRCNKLQQLQRAVIHCNTCGKTRYKYKDIRQKQRQHKVRTPCSCVVTRRVWRVGVVFVVAKSQLVACDEDGGETARQSDLDRSRRTGSTPCTCAAETKCAGSAPKTAGDRLRPFLQSITKKVAEEETSSSVGQG